MDLQSFFTSLLNVVCEMATQLDVSRHLDRLVAASDIYDCSKFRFGFDFRLCPCPLCYRKQEGDEKKCFLSHTVIFNFVVNAIYHSIGF